jgi:menaquinol-cytochrome c reductase iron-sulfur subunit
MKINRVHTTSEIPSYQVGASQLRNPPPPDSGVRDELLVSGERRSFLGLMTGFIGATISGWLGITLARFSIAPALSATSKSEWITIAPSLEEIPDGKPTSCGVVVSQNAGWGHFSSDQSVWVVKKGDHLKVFSSVCPHLGCTINEKASGFGCVCHNSAWNGEGEKTGGPAPRGMDILEYKVESNVLKVRYQNFKQGVAEKLVAS